MLPSQHVCARTRAVSTSRWVQNMLKTIISGWKWNQAGDAAPFDRAGVPSQLDATTPTNSEQLNAATAQRGNAATQDNPTRPQQTERINHHYNDDDVVVMMPMLSSSNSRWRQPQRQRVHRHHHHHHYHHPPTTTTTAAATTTIQRRQRRQRRPNEGRRDEGRGEW